MKRSAITLAAALLLSAPAQAQVTAVTGSLSTESYRLATETNRDGLTLVKVVQPEGALLAVWDGKRRIHEDDIPTSFNAAPDIFYRFVVRLSDGRVWEKKLSVKRGQTSTLSVLMDAPAVAEEEHHRRHHDDAPPPPQAMSADDFSALKAAIMREDFEPQKMTVLQTAVTSAWFTISQVGELVDMFNFTSGKTKVVEVTRARILDMNNASQIYTHFDFESDKKRVRAILGH